MEFKYKVRDLESILKEWLPTEEVFACERFRDNFSRDDICMYLDQGYRVAREIVYPINAPENRIGARMEEGRVIPPPGYREVYKFLKENGWGSSSECIRLPGGMPLILYPDFSRKNRELSPFFLLFQRPRDERICRVR